VNDEMQGKFILKKLLLQNFPADFVYRRKHGFPFLTIIGSLIIPPTSFILTSCCWAKLRAAKVL